MENFERPTLTVKVSNIPETAVAQQLLTYLESLLGENTIFAINIFTVHKNWMSRGHGRVQFDSREEKTKALSLSKQRKLVFRGHYLSLEDSLEDIITRPVDPRNRVESNGGLVLFAGVMVKSNCMRILESWDGVKLWVMPEKRKLELFVNNVQGDSYKLEVGFGDLLQSRVCSLDGDDSKSVDAILLKLKHAPKIFKKVSGSDVASRFRTDRFHICKEDFDFLWVRTTDFSELKSFGYMTCLLWEIEEGFSGQGMYSTLPFYQHDVMELRLERVNDKKIGPSADLVPIVHNHSDFKIAYEILFQLNSLVHTQKLSLATIDTHLYQTLSGLDTDTALFILQKLHNLQHTCYEPVSFIENQSSIIMQNGKKPTPKKLKDHVMSCHRILLTPSKIFFLGPELESTNYIVQNFAEHASDFLRVTFVDEDWGRLSANAVSTYIKQGIFAKPFKTNIYLRILSVLRDGIVIGDKKFEFLAFSASQLRSNSVWMFASNEHVKAEDIRQWMGSFNKIRSISKCSARMGQLFSSSKQTSVVQPREVDIIPDIEVVTDGVNYCFSDGIGKISYAFAKEVSRKLGLSHIPSAFQIRYGGYKGVIAVDRKSFRKLALRKSMLKFESTNCMLNVTKCSESMPCYLNREIIVLLSTLGVEDDVFLSLLNEQLQSLGKMLTNSEAALKVLASTGGSEMKSIMGRMLLEGYEATKEPYLLMMLKSYFQNQLSDIRSRTRIFVPKGRVVVGCLDETRTLEYGQVYVRLTMNKAELQSGDQPFFKRMNDNKTCVVIGTIVVTKNPCLHPGDVRVLEAVWDENLLENDMVDCLVFPQKGDRPHPNECSGGDLDGDQYFVSWDQLLIPPRTVPPMDYTGRRPRIMDHTVTLEEIQKFFADYMISDTLGAISTAHLVHADREPDKALSSKCLELASLHSMAVDFAKSGAPAEMPRSLKPREFPDFMERWEKPFYESENALGKLYRATRDFVNQINTDPDFSNGVVSNSYDQDLVVDGYETFVETAESHKKQYMEKMETLLNYYGAENEVEILTGDMQRKSAYLQYDNRRYGEVKERILVSVKNMVKEVKGWFEGSCSGSDEREKLASAWYYVTYHSSYADKSRNCLGFPWVVGDILMGIKSAAKNKMVIG